MLNTDIPSATAAVADGIAVAVGIAVADGKTSIGNAW